MQRYGIHGFIKSSSNPIDFWEGFVCSAHTAPTRAQLGKRCSGAHLGLPHLDMNENSKKMVPKPGNPANMDVLSVSGKQNTQNGTQKNQPVPQPIQTILAF